MSTAIYRKYRSQTFADLQGQDLIKDILIEAVKTGKIAHAYLFSGPRGTGKTSTARLLAKALNDPEFAIKGDITSDSLISKKIEQGTFLDLVEIDAASNRGIEEIRELREKVKFLPVEGTYKVYIIDEAHMLTREAFNALLKTLEEPPKHVVFILATTEPHKIPVTILSRLQKFNFRLGSLEEISQKLKFILAEEGRQMNEDTISVIYKQSGGSFRDAESILDKVLNSSPKKEITREDVFSALDLVGENILEDFLKSIYGKELENSLSLVEQLEKQGKDLGVLLNQLIDYLRKEILLLAKANKNYRQELVTLNAVLDAVMKLRHYNDPKLLLEIMLVKLMDPVEKPHKEVSKAEAIKPSLQVASPAPKVQPAAVAAEPVQIAEKDDRYLIVLNWLKKISTQLWMFLKVSEINMVGSTVQVVIRNRTAAKQLQESDKYSQIEAKLKEIYGAEDVVIIAEMGEQVGPEEQQKDEPNLSGDRSNRNIVESIL